MGSFDAYVRVSQVGKRTGPSFQSPSEQRKKIEQFAQVHGHTLTWHPDELDVSGGTMARPVLDGIMERIRAGKTDGIIVAKLDRFARSLIGALDLLQEMAKHDATLISVSDNIDMSTPTGKAFLRILLVFGELERERIAESWTSARGNAVDRGVFVGPAPLGFGKNEDGSLRLDDDAADVLRSFQVSGDDGLDAAVRLLKELFPSRYWTPTTARRLFGNRVYLGEVKSGEFVLRNAHPAIVDQTTWDFAQHPPREGRKMADAVYPLSGIATCAACGWGLVGHRTGRNGARLRAYRCKNADCPARVHVNADHFETLVLDAVRGGLSSGERGLKAEEILRYSQAILRASHELEQYVTSVSISDPELWQKGLTARKAACATAQADYDAAREHSRELPDLDEPTPADMRTIFERTIKTATAGRAAVRGEALDRRVKVKLAA